MSDSSDSIRSLASLIQQIKPFVERTSSEKPPVFSQKCLVTMHWKNAVEPLFFASESPVEPAEKVVFKAPENVGLGECMSIKPLYIAILKLYLY